MIRSSLFRGGLWTGLFACTVLAVVCVVFGFEAAGWREKLGTVQEAPVQIRAILLDKEFQAGHARSRKRETGRQKVKPTRDLVWKWINETAKEVLNQDKLNVKEMPSKEGIEILATFELKSQIGTDRLQKIIQEIEQAHPGLVCKELTLKKSDLPHKYEVSHIVFSVFVSSS